MQNFTAMIQKWWAQPFQSGMSVSGWFLFLGLLLIIVIAWNLILRFVTEGAVHS